MDVLEPGSLQKQVVSGNRRGLENTVLETPFLCCAGPARLRLSPPTCHESETTANDDLVALWEAHRKHEEEAVFSSTRAGELWAARRACPLTRLAGTRRPVRRCRPGQTGYCCALLTD